MNDLYFKINPNESKILGSPTTLDTNWNNISGITFLSKDELYDLSWAGYNGIGFIKICSENKDTITNLNYNNDCFNLIKTHFKGIVSKNRYEIETSPIEVNESYYIQLTDRCKLSMIMKYNECLLDKNLIFRWKTLNGFKEFNSEEFLNLFNKIQKHTQNLFELEYEICKKIYNCENITSLLELDLNISFENKITL